MEQENQQPPECRFDQFFKCDKWQNAIIFAVLKLQDQVEKSSTDQIKYHTNERKYKSFRTLTL